MTAHCMDVDCLKPLTGSQYPPVDGLQFCPSCYPKHRVRADMDQRSTGELRMAVKSGQYRKIKVQR